jgi:hypothetical protein
MSAPAPEAEDEYSKAGSRPHSRSARAMAPSSRASWAAAAVGLAGAALLLVAEFTALYVLHISSYGAQPRSVSAGSHNAYALVPIAALAAALALAGARGSVAALWALVALGLIAILIAMLGDLPDTRARGITHGLAFASTTAGTGLYLETLGAVLLVAGGGAGLLWRQSGNRAPRRRDRREPPSRRRGARLQGRASGKSAS